jgi:hypothetical protein
VTVALPYGRRQPSTSASRAKWTDEDVRKLTAVARALDDGLWELFVLFAKCGKFTPTEIERCKAGRRKLFEDAGRTVDLQDIIMLSRRELEPLQPVRGNPEGI